MKQKEHRIFLLLSSVRVTSFVDASGCLFVRQENESRLFCLSPIGWIVSLGAADEERRPVKFCAKIRSARGMYANTWEWSEFITFFHPKIGRFLYAARVTLPESVQPLNIIKIYLSICTMQIDRPWCGINVMVFFICLGFLLGPRSSWEIMFSISFGRADWMEKRHLARVCTRSCFFCTVQRTKIQRT